MRKIVYFSPGIATSNIGDEIIADSAKRSLKTIFKSDFIVTLPTHSPISFYQLYQLRNYRTRIVLGSNLLKSTFFGYKRQWDVTLIKSLFAFPTILLGVGWWQYNNGPNFYTKILLRKMLAKNSIHSVRDKYTLDILNKIGIKNVVNTGCPSLWMLDNNHCSKIKSTKSKIVVFTLTDYNQEPVADKILIEELTKNYDEIFFWPQGSGDFDYLKKLLKNNLASIKFIEPNLESFDDYLRNNECDYVGTRLHAGIRALQNYRRSLIISIDNRAEEMSKSFNIPILSRININQIKYVVNNRIDVKIKIDKNAINAWKNQFGIQ